MKFVELLWFFAILLGISAIFSIAPFEIALNAIMNSLAILALIWIHIARKSLSPASSLRRFAFYIFLCLIFMFLFSAWNLITQIFPAKGYWGYLWLGTAYLFLIVSSYKLMKIGVEFGFSSQASDIKRLLKKKATQK